MTIRQLAKTMAAMVIAVAFVGAATAAQASTVLVTNEAGITNNGNLSWGALGTNGTVVANPFTLPVPGVAGLTITGSQGDSPFERRDQGSGWGGNFGNGEQLLWSRGAFGPMEFAFNQAISGFGSQVQANFYGAFTAVISAYDAGNVLLGSYQVNGVSNGNGDDSAIFIGILSDALDIRRIVVSVPVATSNVQDFSINSPRIQNTGNAVPEPASMLLLGTGLAGAAVRRLRRRSA